MGDKYYRLVCLVVNVCAELLRKYFLNLAQSDTATTYTDLKTYLTARHPEIKQLVIKKIIRGDQYGLLFPSTKNTNESEWDVTLIITLLQHLFKIESNAKLILNTIRDERNMLQHRSNTKEMTDKEFDQCWSRLERAAKDLAKLVSDTSGTYEKEIAVIISEEKVNNLPGLGDALKTFYEEIIKQMAYDMQILKDSILKLENTTDSAARNSQEASNVLLKVTATKGRSGKRVKTFDNVLSGLKQSFRRTMSRLEKDYKPGACVDVIKTELRDKHHVVVTGNCNSRYLDTALYVIRDLDYDMERCVEMNSASDWRHIQPDDVDLVLCRNPFGNYVYDDNKTCLMLDIFDDILGAVEANDGENNIDFVIVTNEDCLPKDRKVMAHKLMKEGIKLTDTTTDAQLCNLSRGVVTQHPSNHCCKRGDFLKYMTSTILDNYSKHIANIDQAKLEEARELLRRHQRVAISGPFKSGKTSISVALAKSYMPDEALFLHSPDDIRNIDFQTTLLVVIDDFGGKYRFDWMKVNEWFTCFDLLHEAVTAGKLNVVVTCETKKLQNCIKKVSMHPLLSFQLQLNKNKMLIKQELLGNSITSNISHGSSISNHLPGTSVGVSRDDVRSVQSVRQYSVRIDSDKVNCGIWGCCMLPGGEILLLDYWNKRLKKLDSAYNVISVCVCDLPGVPRSVCDLPDDFRGVCYIGNNVAVVTVAYQLVYVDVSSMTVRNTVTTDHLCDSITCHNDKLYVTSDDTVYMYTQDGNNRSTLYKPQKRSVYITGIAVSGDGNRIYITDENTGLITIDNFGNLLNSLTFPDARAVCVDDRGNVWVGGRYNKKLYQVSADGSRLLGEVSVDKLYDTRALCYDRDRSSLIAAGCKDNIHVVQLD